jgi:hypothetical protein
MICGERERPAFDGALDGEAAGASHSAAVLAATTARRMVRRRMRKRIHLRDVRVQEPARPARPSVHGGRDRGGEHGAGVIPSQAGRTPRG